MTAPAAFRLGGETVQHAWIWDRFTQMLEPAEPRHHPFDAHAEPAVRDAAEASQVEVPLECVARQVMLFDSLEKQLVVVDALAS